MRTAVAVAILIALTGILLWNYRVPQSWSPALAVLRGALQLAAISFILSGVITNAWWVACALLVMFSVAAITAARRIGNLRAHLAMVACSLAAGVAVTLGVIFLTGALEPSPRYLLAIGGIVIGNAMSIASLTGLFFLRSTADRWDDVEGWLALGATPRQSTTWLTREAVRSALIPSIDQTKTTGIVTLPGAFVGAIFGGLSPLEAGRFQVIVLAGILAAGAISAVVVATWLAPVRHKPVMS